MLFDEKRLQMESATQLIQCPIHTVEPFALMLAPVYVLMKLNQKFRRMFQGSRTAMGKTDQDRTVLHECVCR